jgi:hypothetical protein
LVDAFDAKVNPEGLPVLTPAPAPVADEHPALGLDRDNPFPDWDQPAGDLPTLTPATYPGESPFPDDDDGPSPLAGSGPVGESDDASSWSGLTTGGDGDSDNPYADGYFSAADLSLDSGGTDRSQEGGE